jgi:hypothetical protein
MIGAVLCADKGGNLVGFKTAASWIDVKTLRYDNKKFILQTTGDTAYTAGC